ncbi:MAG: hypothetical protein GXY83_10970 [Rhodopirellula sp.]|nr:hypothetical protein [Rhodopirellula sp.]
MMEEQGQFDMNTMNRSPRRLLPGRGTGFGGLAAIGCLALSTCYASAAYGATKPEAGSVLIENGSFERVQRLSSLPKSEVGTWMLKSDLQAPAVWTLNPAYPGTLEVVERDAFEGERFLRIAAGAKNAAHVTQPCPTLRHGVKRRFTLRYRGGPVELKVYEYDSQSKFKTERQFAEGTATSTRNGAWATLEGVYGLPESAAHASFVVSVPAGSEADLDDVRAERFVRQSDAAINVRDFGASGSEFETTAETTAGSAQVLLKDVGDFQVGQQMAVSRCNPVVTNLRIWEKEKRPGTSPAAEIEIRGYDGSLGNWTVYMLDFAGTDPPTFRWSDDLAVTWNQTEVPVTGQWQKLSGGVEVKFGNRDWTAPCVVTFDGRDQLVSTIERIEGNIVTLSDPAAVAVKECVVRHSDSGPLQAALDRAVAEGRNVFIPSGRYCLTRGLNLNHADGITVQGENEERTILDIRNGTGACITVKGGTSVTLRNLRFRGFSGFAERELMLTRKVDGYRTPFDTIYGMYLKSCRALRISSPERLVVENCHGSGMSAECFYSQSTSRYGNSDPPTYTKSIVYRNCTVSDCAFSAFNNNDMAENTAVLYCRIQDVGGQSWEGASRFVKFVGNYLRNTGPVWMGSICSRAETFDVLPSGQHFVAHNTFEQGSTLYNVAVFSHAGSTPVIINNNIFVNYNSSAIKADGNTSAGAFLPAANTIISGNAIDLTCVRGDSRDRVGITVSADDTIVSDNQIYVRGDVDPHVKGMVLTEPARNIVVHDNIIRGCAIGMQADKKTGRIGEVIDARTFKSGGAIPWPRRRTHHYRGCKLAWFQGDTALPGPEIEAFDPDKGVFRLSSDCELKQGAAFAVYSPQGFNWNVHHNVINNCDRLVDLDVFGGPTAVFGNNLLFRGEVKHGKVAVSIRGAVGITHNHFAGFDGPDSVALMLHVDPFGKVPRLICRDNVFEQCTNAVAEGAAGVWAAADKGGNVFGDPAETPKR